MVRQITDMETWLLDNDDRIYRFWVYKRMFTPEEQVGKYTDQSEFVNVCAQNGRIVEAIDLNGDWLIGFEPLDVDGYIEYHKLSDIKIAYCANDSKNIID